MKRLRDLYLPLLVLGVMAPVTCDWIGNSAMGAKQHYLQPTEEDFERAAPQKAKQNAKQHMHVEPRTESHAENDDRRNSLSV